MFTAATVRGRACNPLPAHFTFALTPWKQTQQEKCKSTSTSISARRASGGSLLTFALGAVLRPRLFSVGDALGVEDAADDVVAHARQVADAAAADEHDGGLLQVVPLARGVRRHLH